MAESLSKQLEQFVAGLKPVTPDVISVPEETAKSEVSEVAIAEEGTPCFSREFKHMVGVLPGNYVGYEIKDFLVEFMDSVPECEVTSG
jgi:hypothetical protein